MTKTWTIRPLLALFLPLALLMSAPAAAGADTYESSWDGGQIALSDTADFTQATIDHISASFDECGTATGETSCTWEIVLTLHSNPETRCNPATPEDQVVWQSGPQPGNGSFEDGGDSFALEGCRGQNLLIYIGWKKTYDETAGPFRVSGAGSQWALFPFGYHPFEEAERRVIEANPPAAIPPPPTPSLLAVAGDCRSLTIGGVNYVFSFRRISCAKASNLAKMRHISGQAPSGYRCRNVQANGGVICWRDGHREKRLEWRLPGTKPASLPAPR
jgi:hypothetical protein